MVDFWIRYLFMVSIGFVIALPIIFCYVCGAIYYNYTIKNKILTNILEFFVSFTDDDIFIRCVIGAFNAVIASIYIILSLIFYPIYFNDIKDDVLNNEQKVEYYMSIEEPTYNQCIKAENYNEMFNRYKDYDIILEKTKENFKYVDTKLMWNRFYKSAGLTEKDIKNLNE